MGLRNLPTQEAAQLASLIACRPHQVSSMGLASFDAPVDMTMLAFSAGEEVSEEAYEGDTLYYLVEGQAEVDLPDRTVRMRTGDVLMVPRGTLNAVRSVGDFKVLQITLP